MFCTNEATYIQANKVKKYRVGTSKTTYTTTRWLEPVKYIYYSVVFVISKITYIATLCFVSVKPRILQPYVWYQKNHEYYNLTFGTRKTTFIMILCVVQVNHVYYNLTFGTSKTTFIMILCVVPVNNVYYNFMLGTR